MPPDSAERRSLPDHSASDDFGVGRFRKVEDANEYIGVLRNQRDRLKERVAELEAELEMERCRHADA